MKNNIFNEIDLMEKITHLFAEAYAKNFAEAVQKAMESEENSNEKNNCC